jgi:hypothetical protein
VAAEESINKILLLLEIKLAYHILKAFSLENKRKRQIQPVYNYCSFCCILLSLSLQDLGKWVDHGINESSTF